MMGLADTLRRVASNQTLPQDAANELNGMLLAAQRHTMTHPPISPPTRAALMLCGRMLDVMGCGGAAGCDEMWRAGLQLLRVIANNSAEFIVFLNALVAQHAQRLTCEGPDANNADRQATAVAAALQPLTHLLALGARNSRVLHGTCEPPVPPQVQELQRAMLLAAAAASATAAKTEDTASSAQLHGEGPIERCISAPSQQQQAQLNQLSQLWRSFTSNVTTANSWEGSGDSEQPQHSKTGSHPLFGPRRSSSQARVPSAGTDSAATAAAASVEGATDHSVTSRGGSITSSAGTGGTLGMTNSLSSCAPALDEQMLSWSTIPGLGSPGWANLSPTGAAPAPPRDPMLTFLQQQLQPGPKQAAAQPPSPAMDQDALGSLLQEASTLLMRSQADVQASIQATLGPSGQNVSSLFSAAPGTQPCTQQHAGIGAGGAHGLGSVGGPRSSGEQVHTGLDPASAAAALRASFSGSTHSMSLFGPPAAGSGKLLGVLGGPSSSSFSLGSGSGVLSGGQLLAGMLQPGTGASGGGVDGRSSSSGSTAPHASRASSTPEAQLGRLTLAGVTTSPAPGSPSWDSPPACASAFGATAGSAKAVPSGDVGAALSSQQGFAPLFARGAAQTQGN